MSATDFFKRNWIRFNRFVLGRQFLPVMQGQLKGYLFSTRHSYEYILGNYEDPAVINVFNSWLKPDSVFYDLGANIGFYSLLASRLISEGKIYAFEPSPQSRAVFEKQMQLNGERMKDNCITLLPYAVSDTEKETEFTKNASDGNTYLANSPVFLEARHKIKVKTVSIDGLIEQGYAKPTVLKIDVEGAELDVLKGAEATIRSCRPKILLATHDWHQPGIKDACISFLTERGYTLQHAGGHNKQLPGLDDFIALPSEG